MRRGQGVGVQGPHGQLAGRGVAPALHQQHAAQPPRPEGALILLCTPGAPQLAHSLAQSLTAPPLTSHRPRPVSRSCQVRSGSSCPPAHAAPPAPPKSPPLRPAHGGSSIRTRTHVVRYVDDCSTTGLAPIGLAPVAGGTFSEWLGKGMHSPWAAPSAATSTSTLTLVRSSYTATRTSHRPE